MKKIYIGLSITQAPKEFGEDFLAELKTAIREIPEVEIVDFIGLEGSTQEEVYRYDRKCTEEVDLGIFVADYPAIGLGMEIAFRLMSRKPMLVFAKPGAKVTRMLTGMCAVEHVPLIEYKDAQDIAHHVREALDSL